MSAKDIFHEVVKRALQKDGWQITHDPLSLSVGGVNLSIDLGAERIIAAERQGEKIAVEIKSFLEFSKRILFWDFSHRSCGSLPSMRWGNFSKICVCDRLFVRCMPAIAKRRRITQMALT